MITVERLSAAKGMIDKLTEQGKALYADIEETAQDRARLLTEAEEREQTIDKLNGEIADVQKRNRDLEQRNSRLVDDLMKTETQLTEASALLDNVRATVAKPNGGAPDGLLVSDTPIRRVPFPRRVDTPAGSQGLLPRELTTDNKPPADRDHTLR